MSIAPQPIPAPKTPAQRARDARCRHRIDNPTLKRLLKVYAKTALTIRGPGLANGLDLKDFIHDLLRARRERNQLRLKLMRLRDRYPNASLKAQAEKALLPPPPKLRCEVEIDHQRQTIRVWQDQPPSPAREPESAPRPAETLLPRTDGSGDDSVGRSDRTESPAHARTSRSGTPASPPGSVPTA